MHGYINIYIFFGAPPNLFPHRVGKNIAKMSFWKRRTANITDYDPTYRVVYLGNVLTGWAKGKNSSRKIFEHLSYPGYFYNYVHILLTLPFPVIAFSFSSGDFKLTIVCRMLGLTLSLEVA